MSFQIKDTDYIIGMWYCHTSDKKLLKPGCIGMDVLCQVWRESPTEPWKSMHRYRYYKDDKIHDSDDEKSWWAGNFGEDGHISEEEMIKRMNSVFTLLGEKMGEKHDFLEIRNMGDKLYEAILAADKPWMHIKKVTKENNPEEYERLTKLKDNE